MRYEGNVAEPSNSLGFVSAFWVLPEGPNEKNPGGCSDCTTWCLYRTPQ